MMAIEESQNEHLMSFQQLGVWEKGVVRARYFTIFCNFLNKGISHQFTLFLHNT